MVLPSGPAKSFRFCFGEAAEQPLQLARQADQRIPGAIDREIVAARIDHGDFAPELGHGAQHFQLAREELLVHHRELDVFLDALRAADANAEIIDVAAQHAPGRETGGARCEHGGGGGLAAIVAGRGMAGEGQRVRSESVNVPGMFSFADQNAAGRFRRPADRLGIAQRKAELAVRNNRRSQDPARDRLPRIAAPASPAGAWRRDRSARPSGGGRRSSRPGFR